MVARTTISGTHLADFFGSPPTGREIVTTAHDLWRVADGELAEVWHVEDILGVMQQLGAVPDDGDEAFGPLPEPVAEVLDAPAQRLPWFDHDAPLVGLPVPVPPDLLEMAEIEAREFGHEGRWRPAHVAAVLAMLPVPVLDPDAGRGGMAAEEPEGWSGARGSGAR